MNEEDQGNDGSSVAQFEEPASLEFDEWVRGYANDEQALRRLHEGWLEAASLRERIEGATSSCPLEVGSGILSSLDPTTGEAVFGPLALRTLTDFYASPVAAAGRIYLVGSESETEVLQHGDDEVLAINELDDRFSASPAMVGHELFLRGSRYLYCIGQ